MPLIMGVLSRILIMTRQLREFWTLKKRNREKTLMGKENPRFTATDYSEAEPELWTPEHLKYGVGFRCARSEFGSHHAKRIPRDVQTHLCQCWVIVDNGHLAGYITLLADRLKVF